MKITKIATTVALLAASMLTAHAEALIRSISGGHNSSDVIIGAIPAYSCTITGFNWAWSTPTMNPLPAGTAWTAGIPDYTDGGAYSNLPNTSTVAPLLKNASMRGTVTTSPSGTQEIDAWYDTSSDVANGFSLTVWGPTLNQFGLTGAQNPGWSVETSDSTSVEIRSRCSRAR